MATTSDANVGTLLFHLNELRHPTRMEARLQQISDEYLLLTESMGKKSAANNVKKGKISLEDLLGHLREELEDNLIPLPDVPTVGNSTQFGTELLSKQIGAVVKKLNSSDLGKRKKAIRLLDSIMTSDLAAQQFVESGGDKEIATFMSSIDDPSIRREILHTIASLSAFAPFRATQTAEDVLEKMIDLINAKNRDSIADLDLILWTLSNYCTEHQRLFRLGQKTMAALIELMSHSNEQVSKHALRCVASLTVARANRKVVDAWEGFNSIVSLLDSPSLEISLSAMWALGHMASQECEGLFDQNLSVIRRIARFITTPGISTDQRVIACRCVTNFALLPKARPIVLQEDTVSGLQTIIHELATASRETDAEEFALLEEATVALSRLTGKETQVAESITLKTLNAIVSLLSASNSSSTIVSSCAWCLAYLCRIEKLHQKVELSGGLDAAIKLLWRTQSPLEQLPAAWVVSRLAAKTENQERIRDSDGVVPLVKLLFSKEQDIRLAAANGLYYLSLNSKVKQLIRSLFSKLSQKDSVIEQKIKAKSRPDM